MPGTHSAHTDHFQSKAVKCYSALPNQDFSETMEHFSEIARDTSNERPILAKPLCQTLEVWELLQILEDDYVMK